MTGRDGGTFKRPRHGLTQHSFEVITVADLDDQGDQVTFLAGLPRLGVRQEEPADRGAGEGAGDGRVGLAQLRLVVGHAQLTHDVADGGDVQVHGGLAVGAAGVQVHQGVDGGDDALDEGGGQALGVRALRVAGEGAVEVEVVKAAGAGGGLEDRGVQAGDADQGAAQRGGVGSRVGGVST
jgi:hypothetical protein